VPATVVDVKVVGFSPTHNTEKEPEHPFQTLAMAQLATDLQ
jgi:hypothetical protein